MKTRHIEIFAKSNNEKGDLFCRLTGDFFHAIGYGDPRYNVHKSGREIDLTTEHRTEKKIAIAECKAKQDTIGGSDINKFIGSLDAEKRKYVKQKSYLENDVVGYFVSISGYTETAIEQEKDLGEKRLILIDKTKIIEELIAGKIIYPIEQAVSNVKFKEQQPQLLNYVDLIAHSIGWIWVLYYGDNKSPTHFTLVHAEGKSLLEPLSKEILEFDLSDKNLFTGLKYLKPTNIRKDETKRREEAKNKYFQYIKNECGDIQFEGLPTDKDAGSIRVELENIFQPLHFENIIQNKESKNKFVSREKNREPIGEILKLNTRLAILAKPGGGKSTLLKRIAIAYSFKEKLELVKDDLPSKNWFPIFIRCRELGEFVNRSITEIIENIPNRAEIGSHKEGFSSIISDSLQNGTALLLIDGLDEISDDKNRIQFVNQLRTFLATYPNIHVITTSREAGFRVVGGALANYCKHYKISNLIPEEIKELIIKWHKAIINDSEKTISDAIDLSSFILKDKRIHVLAENPLLLTTLLFVKRWAGYLPTKKNVLYQEMIKLLLVTWNVEGHEQLDIDEAEPQLSFVAYWMTDNGFQTITHDDLKKTLQQARNEMPEILCYTNVSIPDFIRRVESRSSLLILSGHKKTINGNITPIYEFLHLSFQEYLTAKAVVEKHLPKELSNKSYLDIIKPHMLKENWKEVIPLIAVLSKRRANELIEYLIDESKKFLSKKDKEISIIEDVKPPALLGSCIANEIQIEPKLLKVAIEWFAKNRYSINKPDIVEIIARSKFSNLFFDTICDLYFKDYDDEYISPLGGMIGEINIVRIKEKGDIKPIEIIEENILSEDKKVKCIGLLSLTIIAFEHSIGKWDSNTISKNDFKEIEKELFSLVQNEDKHLYFAACWCIAWLGEMNIFFSNRVFKFISFILIKWLNCNERNLSRISAWSLFSLIDFESDFSKVFKIDPKTLLLIKDKNINPLHEYDKILSFYFGSKLGITFEKSDIVSSFKDAKNKFRQNEKFVKMAKSLNIDISEKERIRKAHNIK